MWAGILKTDDRTRKCKGHQEEKRAKADTKVGEMTEGSQWTTA